MMRDLPLQEKLEADEMPPPVASGTRGFLWIALIALVFLFVIGQGSGALLPVHDGQHPGNHYDEVRLTAALNSSESFAALRDKMPWGVTLLGWSYLQHHGLGIETTTGRRLFSVALSALALLYLISVLVRHRLLPPSGAFLAGALWAISETTSLYATIGLTPYALLLLYSVILIHTLSRTDRPLTWTAAGVGGLVFALMTFTIYRTVSGVGAVVASLLIVELMRSRWDMKNYLRIFGKHVLLGAPCLASAVAYLYFFPPEEMLAPRRGFHLYFMLSDVPKTLYGAAYFAVDRSRDLFMSALAPVGGHVGSARVATLLGWVLLGFMLTGWLGSLLKPGGRRFALGLAFLIGVSGHLALCFATIIPYGNMRYFLAFAAFFPVFAVLGMVDLSMLLRRIFSIIMGRWSVAGKAWSLPDPFRPGSRLASGLTVVVLVGMTGFTAHLIYRNHGIGMRIQQGHDGVAAAYREAPAGLALDAWTAVTLQDGHSAYLERDHHVLKPNMRTQWRGVGSEDLAELTAWENYLGAHDRLIGITSLPFRQRYYGPLFDQAARVFQIHTLGGTRSLHFSTFARKSPERELLQDPDDLLGGAWRASGVALSAISDARFRADFDAKGILTQRIPMTVGEGERLLFSVELWAAEAIPGMRLMLKRAQKGPFDGVVEKINVGAQPERHIITHGFRQSWSAIEVGIAAPTDEAATVYLRAPRLRLAAPPESS